MKSQDFQRRVDAARENGWRVIDETPHRVVLKRPSFGSRIGHILIGATTVWWTFGLGNICYALYEYLQHSEFKVVYSEIADEDPLEILSRQYANGEIDESELEQRTEKILDLNQDDSPAKSPKTDERKSYLDTLRSRLR